MVDVDDSALARAMYASDASLYRVPPLAVVRPQHVDEILATLDVCRTLGIPLTMRGAGTSLAGNAVGPGVVLDVSRHLNRVIDIDPDAKTATVEPGVVQADLQRAAVPFGLRFGPDPSTHNRATLGGMIGNNACGARALGYGRTSDNVISLDVVTGTGERLALRAGGSETPLHGELRAIAASNLAVIRTEFGRFGRQISGYALENLLPENGLNVARLLAGSEGTLAVTLGATVQLVSAPKHTRLVVLGYPDMAAAADAVPLLLPHGLTACEGIDSRIVDVVRQRRGATAVPELPRGGGWLFVEVAGDEAGDVNAVARAVIVDAGALDALVITNPVAAAALWRIREDGSGLVARSSDGKQSHAGWEDAAVPPAVLGAYLREFESLLAAHQLTGVPYGHFGDGCVHVRIDFPFAAPEGTTVFRNFLTEAAQLVASYGGSLSGEHGDGRARSELLPAMYSAAALELFGRVKLAFDPAGILNPGVLVDPRSVTADLRAVAVQPLRDALAFAYPEDDHDFSTAVHRCTGVGKCRADLTTTGGVMCPSYQATRDEKDSTRGRARVLQEMTRGTLITGGWRSPEVEAALDLCLSCKACSTDCPTGVDMAMYKSEALYQRYRGRIRPRSHYTLGRLPQWAQLASHTPRLVNALMKQRQFAGLARRIAGVDERRALPSFATQTFRDWFATHRPPDRDGATPLLLFVDSFTNHFTPEVGRAAVQVLTAAGYQVQITPTGTCCGLTAISTGQLDVARRTLTRATSTLASLVAGGTPIVGLEPSCTAVLRSDAVDLLGTNESRTVAAATHTLAELLAATPGYQPPDLTNVDVVAQPHCHHHAVMGWEADAALLRDAGANVDRVGGCCGLAGNFGAERGHYDVSVAVAENALLPALRDADLDGVVLADGFSCRTQIGELAGRRSRHLAELLAAAEGFVDQG